MANVENTVDSMKVKLDHEVPKSAAKVAAKQVAKTEKKLIGLLKDQS